MTPSEKFEDLSANNGCRKIESQGIRWVKKGKKKRGPSLTPAHFLNPLQV